MDYSWLQTECNEITSETFFRREALELGVKDHLEAAGVPVTFIKFLGSV